jgi:hypothetical protein
VIDPTDNVRALTDAAVERLDDLRVAEARFNQAQIDNVKELMTLRSAYDEQLRHKESQRIDAIRLVDVGAVQRAAEVAAAQAEALRNQVAAAATASQTSLAAALDPIQKDIADLRRAQYEAQGQKTQVVETRAGSTLGLQLVAGVVGLLGFVAGVVGVILAVGR